MIREMLRAAALTVAVLFASTAFAEESQLSKGQLIYVPCTSHVYHGVKTRPFELTVTLTMRNTDPWRSMRLMAVEYRGSDGRLIRRMLDRVERIAPLASRTFTVEQDDTSGGAGALFLVRWQADAASMNPLMAEAVMIGTTNGQGISFISRGVVLHP